MADFPGRPSLLKGALVVFETPIPVPTNIIVFQYNPETMTRKISQPAGGAQAGGGASVNPCSTAGDTRNTLQSPVETFSLSVELDAADQLEVNDAVTVKVGLHPALAALEMLLYPPPLEVLLNKALVAFGSAFVVPAQVPIVLFVWGAPRVVPVIVNSVSITESGYDQLLNPIQAKVDLEMRSMTDIELQDAGVLFEALGYINLAARDVLAHLQFGGAVARVAARAASQITRQISRQMKGMLPF
jgi:hypothetical protein